MYLIGEALIGEGNEVAHIDLLIGDKDGPVGQAFANGIINPSAGHTPLLAVIRPNLPPKPQTLIIPKVTIKDMAQASKIFGPAQAAVAKAVADAMEENIIPQDKAEDLVVIASVFIHPEAKDYRRIYHYNYSATKLAIRRALTGYPPLEKVLFEKDRATHPIAGFKVQRLWRPPYLQIALDNPDIEKIKGILSQVPPSDRIILEAGTPLIKRYGVGVVRSIREVKRDAFVVADLKTLDVGQVEVDLAFNEEADAVVCSGLASKDTVDKFIYEARRLGIYSVLDMMGVPDPVKTIKTLAEPPDVVILHRGIDEEKSGKSRIEVIKSIKGAFPDRKILVACAGGIDPTSAQQALQSGADILIVGRYITQSRDVEKACREFLPLLGEDIDVHRVHVE